jgi:teichuronic acid biosynthesis glycosyltransferase TuaC
MQDQEGTTPRSHKPMRVLVVSNHWSKKDNPTFGGVWADRQITALRKLGIEVDTFDLGTSHSPLHLFRRLSALRQQVKSTNPDIVHARYGTLVSLVSVFSGAKTIITYAGSDLLRGAGISGLRACIGILLSNISSLKADGIICVSEELRHALWWQSRKAVVIPDGVDLSKFVPIPRDEARKQIGWDPDKTIVITDAAADPICKGLALSEEAIAQARQRFPSLELHVLKVKPHEMPLYCNAADMLIFASRQEGSPNMVKEAMACNLPIVATPVGDVPQLLAGVCPSAVVARTAPALARATIEVLSQGTRSNGRSKVTPLALDTIATRVAAVYETILSGGQSTKSTAPTPGFIARLRLSLSLDYRMTLQSLTNRH